LNSEGIKRLIAKEFNVNEDKVSVSIRKIYRGYALYEHQENEIYATINE
jgi:hypothetical protein